MIYIDKMMKHRSYPRASRPQCFMVADTLDELHEAAEKIGLPRSAFNVPPNHPFPHYRLGFNQRETALSLNAEVVAHTKLEMIAQKCGFVQRHFHDRHEEMQPVLPPIRPPQSF